MIRWLACLFIASLVLKDGLSILKVLFPELSLVTIIPAASCVIALMIMLPKFFSERLLPLDWFFLIYIFFDFSYFLALNFLNGGFGYGIYYFFVASFYFFLLPFVIYLFARLYPGLYLFSVERCFVLVLPLVLLACAAQIFSSYVDKSTYVDFMMDLYRVGAISYPLQTYLNGYEVRLQGIFYSSFALAVFLLFAIAYILCKDFDIFRKLFFVFGFVALLFYSYNRNGILALSVLLFLYSISFFRFGWFKMKCATPYVAIFLIVLSAVLPLFSWYIDIEPVDSGAIIKVTTILSRVETWKILIGEHASELIFGAGFVQGMAPADGSTLMIDNLFLSKAMQSGVFSATILLLFLCWFAFNSRLAGRREALLYVATASMFSMNNLFYDINYLVFIFGCLVASCDKSIVFGGLNAKS